METVKKKILVVDDEVNSVFVLRCILEDKNYTVTEAYDGEAALRAVSIQKPDLVLLDVTMPKMSGYEVCKSIKSNPETKKIPVILVTGKDTAEDIKTALSNGANWFVRKPYDANYLLNMVANFIKKQ
jgi:CheY-like chemotaxis protein